MEVWMLEDEETMLLFSTCSSSLVSFGVAGDLKSIGGLDIRVPSVAWLGYRGTWTLEINFSLQSNDSIKVQARIFLLLLP